jgi:glutaredoxin
MKTTGSSGASRAGRPLAWFAALLLAACAWASIAAAQSGDSLDPANPAFWYSTGADGAPRIKVHFFWTSRCEHCRAARPFMEDLPARLPYVDLVSRPTDGSASNARLQYSTALALAADPVSVPAIFFCGQAQIGYDSASSTGASIVQRLEECRARLAADPSLLTKPVSVVPAAQRESSADRTGTYVAAGVGIAFVGLIVAGVVLSRRAAAQRERARTAKQGERRRRRR